MTSVRIFGGMMLAAALAACGGQGGELAQDTARRRAETADADSVIVDSAGTPARPEIARMPAFVRVDSADEAAPADADSAAEGEPEPAPAEAWTASTTDRVRTMGGPVVLDDLRMGLNQGFDRLVLQFEGNEIPGYRVEYLRKPAAQCGSGDATRMAGSAWLAVTLRGAQAHDDVGRATVQPRERRLEMPVVREYEFTCDFEGEVQVMLGLAAPNRYRVTELQNPARLIIDVQQ